MCLVKNDHLDQISLGLFSHLSFQQFKLSFLQNKVNVILKNPNGTNSIHYKSTLETKNEQNRIKKIPLILNSVNSMIIFLYVHKILMVDTMKGVEDTNSSKKRILERLILS